MNQIKRRKNGGHLIIEVLKDFNDINDGDMLIRLGKNNRVLKCFEGIGRYNVGRVIWEYNVGNKYDYIFKQFIGPGTAHKFIYEGGYDLDLKIYNFDDRRDKMHPYHGNVVTMRKNGGRLKVKPLTYIFGYTKLIAGDRYVYLDPDDKILEIGSKDVDRKRIGLVREDYGVNNGEKIFNTFTEEMSEMTLQELIEFVTVEYRNGIEYREGEEDPF